MAKMTVDPNAPTEFHKIYQDFRAGELRTMRDEYPLVTVISLVVFAVLGVFNLLSIFSPTAIVSGALLLASSAYLAMSIGKDTASFWESIRGSFAEVKQHFFTADPELEPETSES